MTDTASIRARLYELAVAYQRAWEADEESRSDGTMLVREGAYSKLTSALAAMVLRNPAALVEIFAAGGDGWLPIESAPKDFTGILAAAIGADGRWMQMIVHLGQRSTIFRSDCQMDLTASDCEGLGAMGMRYGVKITHWRPLPTPPPLQEDNPGAR